jgi:hypothetical protein
MSRIAQKLLEIQTKWACRKAKKQLDAEKKAIGIYYACNMDPSFSWSRLKRHGFKYKNQFLLGFIPFDWQVGMAEFISCKYGDCKEIHRFAQHTMRLNSGVEDSYLLTYLPESISKAHTICLIEWQDWREGNRFTLMDYDSHYHGDTVRVCLDKALKARKCAKLRAFVLQDINYDLITVNEIEE